MLKETPLAYHIAAWILAALLLPLVLILNLLPALLAGLLVHELVHILAPRFGLARLGHSRAKMVAVALISAVVVGLLALAIFGSLAFLRSDFGSVAALMRKMAEIIESARVMLPTWATQHMPANAEALADAMGYWLREHASQVQIFGKEAGRTLVHILIGMVLGAMISLHDVLPDHRDRPLSSALSERAGRLAAAFRRIVFAQVRIAALNTLFTGLYLMVVLPLLGIHLPLAKTLIIVTFVAGLLPVIGNLISNTVIVVVSLSLSVGVAVSSLIFLVVIHKLEYFLNAKIVGTQIRAHAWELLLAMLLMEAAFGIAGVIAAPVYYAYLKDELSARRLV